MLISMKHSGQSSCRIAQPARCLSSMIIGVLVMTKNASSFDYPRLVNHVSTTLAGTDGIIRACWRARMSMYTGLKDDHSTPAAQETSRCDWTRKESLLSDKRKVLESPKVNARGCRGGPTTLRPLPFLRIRAHETPAFLACLHQPITRDEHPHYASCQPASSRRWCCRRLHGQKE